jgi:hypothetical protein
VLPEVLGSGGVTSWAHGACGAGIELSGSNNALALSSLGSAWLFELLNVLMKVPSSGPCFDHCCRAVNPMLDHVNDSGLILAVCKVKILNSVKNVKTNNNNTTTTHNEPLVHNADPGPVCSRITKLTARRK